MFSVAFLLLSAAAASAIATPVQRSDTTCPIVNLVGSVLTSSSTSGGIISCTYPSDSNPCTYHDNGVFEGGSSNCTQSITDSDVSAFVCLAFNENYSVSSNGYQLKSSLKINATVIECLYFDNDACYYDTHDGSMHRGSHTCPGSINPTKITVSEFVCASVNVQGQLLIGASVTVSESALACVYVDTTICTYSSHGSLSHGGSLCPITVSSSAHSTLSYPGPLSISTSYPYPIPTSYPYSPPSYPGAYGAAAASYSGSSSTDESAFVCLAFNENYSTSSNGYQLKSSLKINATVVECLYFDNDACYYDTHDGSMHRGSHTCPGSINPTKITVSEFVCVSVNLQAQVLIGASVTVTGSFLACVYADTTMCTYSKQGTLSHGGSWCPTTVSSSSSSYSHPAPTSYPYSTPTSYPYSSSISPPSLSEFKNLCTFVNNDHSQVISGTISPDFAILTCLYDDAVTCNYTLTDGKFNSGSQTLCPATATPAISVPTATAGTGSYGGSVIPFGAVSNDGNAAAGGSSLLETGSDAGGSGTGSTTTISKPVLIALLAMNGFLVVAVLAIVSVWVFGRRSVGNARMRPLNTGSGYKTVDSVSVPLTHSDEGQYYDAPTLKR